MPDLNCFTIESAMSMVAGTARSMGITVNGQQTILIRNSLKIGIFEYHYIIITRRRARSYQSR